MLSAHCTRNNFSVSQSTAVVELAFKWKQNHFSAFYDMSGWWPGFANINIAQFSFLYCYLPLWGNKLDENIFNDSPSSKNITVVSPSWWGHDPGLLAVEADLARSRSPPRNLGCRLQVKTWYDRARCELIVTVLSAVDLASRTGGQHRYAVMGNKKRISFGSIFPGTHTLNSISCQTEGDLIESDLLLSNRENIFSERSKRRTKTLANTNNPRYTHHLYLLISA